MNDLDIVLVPVETLRCGVERYTCRLVRRVFELRGKDIARSVYEDAVSGRYPVAFYLKSYWVCRFLAWAMVPIAWVFERILKEDTDQLGVYDG